MISACPTLAEWPYRMVRLASDLCPRRGQYRKETLIVRFGGDVLMPDVRHLTRNAHASIRLARRVSTRICDNEATDTAALGSGAEVGQILAVST
jgi:hypothetical protein